MKPGTRVTPQPRTWWDGKPVAGWPDPQFLGTVRKVEDWYRVGRPTHVRVKFDSGRLGWESVDSLTRIDGGAS